MGGGKGKAPAPPDYTPIAQSSLDAANVQAQTSRENLDWAKQQYADQKPMTDAFMQSMIQSQQQAGTLADRQMAIQQQVAATDQQAAQMQLDNATKAQRFYEQNFQPMESQFAQTAQGYNTPQRAEQQAGAAEAGVAQGMDAQRSAALQGLEGFGIDPSQTRYGALDLGTRVSQAAATAAAGTQSRLNTEGTGLALKGEAINIGRGYPGQVANAYGTSINAGQGSVGSGAGVLGAEASGIAAGNAGINAGLNTSNTYGNLMGTSSQWASLANQSRGMGANVMNLGFQNQLAGFNANTAIAQNEMSGLGGLAGAAIVGGGLAIGI
jgi:hypothetical protein